MKKNVYRFYYLKPDKTRLYHLDTSCNVSEDKGYAKHYINNNPKVQKTTIEKNFMFMSKQAAYCGSKAWKGVNLEQVTVNYEIVPEDERRPYDHQCLANPTWGVSKEK